METFPFLDLTIAISGVIKEVNYAKILAKFSYIICFQTSSPTGARK